MVWPFSSSAKITPVNEAAIKESWANKDLLPQYGDLLTFPLEVLKCEAVNLAWREHNRPRTSTYYRVRGWFKTLVRDKDQSYYVDDWEKAWDLATGSREIGGVPNQTSETEQSLATSSWRTKDGWAQMTCNEELFYGQAASKTSRFIIYHPRRDIYQGRFKQDTAQIVFESIAAKIPEVKVPFVGVKIAAMDPVKAAQLGALLLNATGDTLRQFIHPSVTQDKTLLDAIDEAVEASKKDATAARKAKKAT